MDIDRLCMENAIADFFGFREKEKKPLIDVFLLSGNVFTGDMIKREK